MPTSLGADRRSGAYDKDACWFPSLTNASRPAVPAETAGKGHESPRGVKRGDGPEMTAPAMTLITDNEALAAFCAPHAQRALRRDRHRVHARPHLLPQALPGAGRGRGARRSRSIRWRPASTSAPLLALMADERGAQGDARRPAGPRDLLPSRPPAAAVLRHPGRGHGVRLRRGGRLRHAGGQAGRRPRSTRARASPTGRAGRCRRRRSTTRWATSPTCG